MANLIAGPNQGPQVRVSWDAPSEGTVTGHTVSRDDGQSFQVSGGATTYSDRAIEPGMSYSYTVTAQSDAGNSPASDPVTASIPAAPTAPRGLTATAAEPELSHTSASVTITWNPATVYPTGACEQAFPVTGYVAERLHGDGSTVLADLDPGASSFTDYDADFGTEYTYRVYATSNIGNGPAATAELTTPLRPVAPPTGLTAALASDPFDGTVTLSWQPSAEGPEPTGYRVDRSDGTGRETLVESHPDTAYDDTVVTAGATYQYQVFALMADNQSGPSNTATIQPPAAPDGITASAAGGAVNLAWQAPERGSVLSYRVERQTGGGDWTRVADTAGTSHTDHLATPDSTHVYRVQNRNAHGGSAWTLSEAVATLRVPGQPVSLTAQQSGENISVTWQAPGTGRVDGYHLRYGPDETGEFTNTDFPASQTSFVHGDNQEGVRYGYQVRAYNQAGNGPWSDTATATRINPPGTPENLSANLDGDDILLSWERPGSVSVDGYTVRHRAGDGEYVHSAKLNAEQTSFRLTDVQGGVLHRLSVRAHNRSGESPWSDEAEILRQLPPGAPHDVTAQVDGQDIIFSWSAPETGAVDGYHVSYEPEESQEETTVELEADSSSFTHTGAQEGVTYAYRVRAHNPAGNGPWSAPATAMWLNPPPPPTGVAAGMSGAVIILSWTAPASGIVDSYEIQYGTADGELDQSSTVDSGGETTRTRRATPYTSTKSGPQTPPEAASGPPGSWQCGCCRPCNPPT